MTRKSKLIGVILTSVLVSVSALLWFNWGTQEARCTVAVHLENIPVGMTVIGDWEKTLKVKIRGSKSRIKSVIGDQNIAYPLDLKEAKERVNTFNIDTDHFSFPRGISILSVEPSFLTLKIDKEIKKSFPVKIVFSGKPAPGFVIADAVTDPVEVILKGPETILENLEQVQTKPVDVAEAQETIQKESMLDLPEGVTVLFPEKMILSSIFIEEKIVTRKIHGFEVKGKDADWPYSITPPTIDLELKGHEKDIDKLITESNGGLAVFVDLKALKPGVYVRYATVILPGNVTLVSVEPTIFTVILEKQGA